MPAMLFDHRQESIAPTGRSYRRGDAGTLGLSHIEPTRTTPAPGTLRWHGPQPHITETRPPSQAGRFHWADNQLPCGIDVRVGKSGQGTTDGRDPFRR